MAVKLRKRTVRKMRRNALFLAALVGLVLIVVIAFELAPRNDDAPMLRVPTASEE